MGKPFKKELGKLSETFNWAASENVDRLRDFFVQDVNTPLYIVGSGGSLSACYFAASLYHRLGGVGKAVTPLELFSLRSSLRKAKVLFISASGANSDILFSFKLATTFEPRGIFCITMKPGSALEKLADECETCRFNSFEIPTGKDGFLATNTLIAYFTILAKSFEEDLGELNHEWHISRHFIEVNDFVDLLSSDYTITVLFGGWGQAVGYDIESKFTEAALGNVLLSDFRNFGHGRHHWFAKRAEKSAIIALITPDEEILARKTLALLPAEIPRLVIHSGAASAAASIELLWKSFYVVSAMGDIQGIDPGRPGVPDFGSKLYHLKYLDLFRSYIDREKDLENRAIKRKADVASIDLLPSQDIQVWKSELRNFIKNIESQNFSSIIFDYDGTLCDREERSEGISAQVANELIRILKSGVVVGIASGRGKSVRIDLQKKIPQVFWERVVVGYYNGSEIALLSENSAPDIGSAPHQSLKDICTEISENLVYGKYIQFTLRANQLSIETIGARHKQVRDYLISLSMKHPGIGYVESSHSIDLILSEKASKLNVLAFCQEISEGNCLCIGDKGQWPGNDYDLLSTPFSLSVDEVSALSTSCWNLVPSGLRGVSATLYYLSRIDTSDKFAKIKI